MCYKSLYIMFTYPTLLISYVYTVLYTIYCILPMPHGHPYIYTYIFLLIPSHLCVHKVVVVKLLDITARSELEAKAFHYTCINIC